MAGPQAVLAIQQAAGNRTTTAFVQRKTFWEQVQEEWSAIRNVGLLAIPIGLNAHDLQDEVWAAAAASGLPAGLNGPQDALRHAYLSALLNALNGSGDAVRGFLRNHEETTGNPASIQSRMDYHNNDVGIRIGALCRDEMSGAMADPQLAGVRAGMIKNYCWSQSRAAVDNGTTVYLPATVQDNDESTWRLIPTSDWRSHDPTYWQAPIYSRA